MTLFFCLLHTGCIFIFNHFLISFGGLPVCILKFKLGINWRKGGVNKGKIRFKQPEKRINKPLEKSPLYVV